MKRLLFFLAVIVTSCAQNEEYYYDLSTRPGAGTLVIEDIPDGNWKVTAVIGSPTEPGVTTILAETRRLFVENLETKPGEFVTCTFVVNKRDSVISPGNIVRLSDRERDKLDWDSNLSFEFTGAQPRIKSIKVEPAGKDVITLYLCGDSTTVDQDDDPWASWGQMITRFFDDKVAVANYAESGRSSNTFIFEKRLEKIMSLARKGDYIFSGFGHNDEKQRDPDSGAYGHFTKYMQMYVDSAAKAGCTADLLTPTARRSFDSDGRSVNTHGDFPRATRDLAAKGGVAMIDLTEMVTAMYEALGVENSKKLLVHYPANSFIGQDAELADNTHFNPFGAYEVAKCVLQGIKANRLPLAEHIKDFDSFDPARPDNPEDFVWTFSGIDTLKPEGN